MSQEAMEWGRAQRTGDHRAKAVLMYLCNRHHPDFGCNPSLDIIAAYCEITRRNARTQIERLVKLGLIRVEKSPLTGHGQPLPRFRFAFEPGFAEVAA